MSPFSRVCLDPADAGSEPERTWSLAGWSAISRCVQAANFGTYFKQLDRENFGEGRTSCTGRFWMFTMPNRPSHSQSSGGKDRCTT